MIQVVQFVAGGVLLILGADWLVKGASLLAARFGVSPLVIGLTVVAFGTSAPELAVSVLSSATGQSDIAVGNVVGSNIFNVLLILGVSAIAAPLIVQHQLVILDVPLMIAASVVVWLFSLDGEIGFVDGIILFASLIAYLTFLLINARRGKLSPAIETPELPFEEDSGEQAPGVASNLFWIALGLAGLVIGSNFLVEAAVSFATWLGVSQLVVGLTVVAVGTSLPELATSVMASIRGERDIAVGNVVGSNLFNLLCVLGLTGIVAPDGVSVSSSAIEFDMPVMIVVAIACLPIFFHGNSILRWEGWLFFGYFVLYVARTVLSVTDSSSVTNVDAALQWFFLPLTAITLMVITVREFRRRTGSGGEFRRRTDDQPDNESAT